MSAYWNLGVWMHEVHVSKNFEYTTASEVFASRTASTFECIIGLLKSFTSLQQRQ